jgi:hypothetical protein
MLVSDILDLLPASLEWMVLFRLEALRPYASDDTINSMFYIWEASAQGDESLDAYSHVILTSAGVRLAPLDGEGLYNPANRRVSPAVTDSYAKRFAAQLADFDVNAMDCLGAGELTDFFPPVVMWVKLEGHLGRAGAYFARQPGHDRYDLLQAVGVQFESGQWLELADGETEAHGQETKSIYLAKFSLDLRQHILAGELSGFSKTGYCNAFFLQQGSIGQTLEAGLTQAASQRVEHARRQGTATILEMARQAAVEPQPMWCHPPPPKEAFPFGDLVPLGFLLRALRSIEAQVAAEEAAQLSQELTQYLLQRRSGELWPFQSGDIPTATDSALILLGLEDREAVGALEMFDNGQGGYFPQLWNHAGDETRMQVGEWNRHWCQPDFATTCLIRAHRRQVGLPELTALEYLETGFENRGGLFFANPYLVDYALALALQPPFDSQSQTERSAIASLQTRLAGEIMASLNPDYSFGSFDLPLSSALAVLSLEALGENAFTQGWGGQRALLAKLRLANWLQTGEPWLETAPFYSTFKLPGLDVYLISLYLDRSRVITTAALSLALGVQSGPEELLPLPKQERHPRYACDSAEEYITRSALPPYTNPGESAQEAVLSTPQPIGAGERLSMAKREAQGKTQDYQPTTKEVQ